MIRPLRTEIAIIGGGIVGASAALHLRLRGVPVVLLEQATCGSQASGVNYGGVRQQGRDRCELPLARRARKLWGRLAELIGTDGEFQATGHLRLARSPEAMAGLEAHADMARVYGLELELLDREALRARFPWVGESIAGASLCAEDGQANPRLVSPAFARAAAERGAVIREHSRVLAIERDGGRFRLTTEDGLEVSARVLVNAAGAWGREVAAMFGEDVPETVIAPNMCVTEPLHYFLVPNLGVAGGHAYIRQIPRGNVIFGGWRGLADKEVMRAWPQPESTLAAIRETLEIIPGLKHAHVIRTWTGIEGAMPDELPVIGASTTTPDLFHAFGFSGHGFQLGPAVGAVLAELILDGWSPTPIDGLRIDRFLAGSAAD